VGPQLDEAGIGEDHFLPVVWELLQHRGFAWAVPTTPGGIGLHWNRRLFAEAGLDPDRPPQTLDELDAMAETLTVVDVERSGQTQRVRYVELTDDEKSTKQFDIVQLGFSPMEPNWFKDSWGYWFGGSLDDGAGRITADSPENVAALDWVGSYTRKFGVSNKPVHGRAHRDGAAGGVDVQLHRSLCAAARLVGGGVS